ncbi:putative transcription factor C2H2 family [Helianthus annuus]|nr:putative transcription factor C2H2 family [Helianthus annuus]
MEGVIQLEFGDDEDEFRSCCGDEDELEEIVKNGDDELDEFSVRMLFKGVSVSDPGNGGFGVSGIGVIMEGPNEVPVIRVQKKLEFFVEEDVADYLALMDGLVEAIRRNVKRVYAFTDSQILFDQITNEEVPENPLLMALKQRILEHVKNLEHFVLKCVPDVNLEPPLHLARVAIGVVHDATGDPTVENCLICCEDKPSFMTVTLKCSHKCCSHCLKAYVDEKVGLSEVPIRCPSPKCRYYISAPEHKSFLPVGSFMSLEEALLEPNACAADKFYCPFVDCAVLLDPSSDADSTDNRVKCPVCSRFICVKCGVRWHASVSCDEFQEVSAKEMNVADGDAAFDCLVENRRWKRCQMCERMIELTHGCYDLTCWCGHEFCYSCGAEYVNGQQTCECASWGDEEQEEENDQLTLTSTTPSDPGQQFEEWAWESFGSLSNMMDAYSDQERSQLALIQRFLAGGFSLGDHHTNPCESSSSSSSSSCADDDTSYIDNTIKDLHQLPWLERFVSVISDNYYDECGQ